MCIWIWIKYQWRYTVQLYLFILLICFYILLPCKALYHIKITTLICYYVLKPVQDQNSSYIIIVKRRREIKCLLVSIINDHQTIIAIHTFIVLCNIWRWTHCPWPSLIIISIILDVYIFLSPLKNTNWQG